MSNYDLFSYPYRFVILGLLATVYGISLIRQGLNRETLLAGTKFTYLPPWLFVLGGVLLQLPLPVALWFLAEVERAR